MISEAIVSLVAIVAIVAVVLNFLAAFLEIMCRAETINSDYTEQEDGILFLGRREGEKGGKALVRMLSLYPIAGFVHLAKNFKPGTKKIYKWITEEREE